MATSQSQQGRAWNGWKGRRRGYRPRRGRSDRGIAEATTRAKLPVLPVRVVEIPKPKGGTRPLGIATVEDRIVQTAMKLVMEPIFEAEFQECSYGYRPRRNAKQASEAIQQDLYQQAWSVVEIDFQ